MIEDIAEQHRKQGLLDDYDEEEEEEELVLSDEQKKKLEEKEKGTTQGGVCVNPVTGEIGGPRGPEPVRYGDWESKGRCIDF